MTDSTKTKRAFVVRNFRDAGTGERFTANDTPNIEERAFANYEAAGLVRKPSADDSNGTEAKTKRLA